jgi:hypothetical protein
MNEYKLFLDESGTSSLKNIDPNFPILVLTGLLISAEEYELLKQKIDTLKRKYFNGKTVILHRRDMRKYERGFEIFFDDAVKKHFYSDLNAVLADANYMLISSAIDKKRHIAQYGKLADDPYQIALSFVLERVIYETDNKNASVEVFIESRGKKEDKVIDMRYKQLLGRGTYQVTPERFSARFDSDIELKRKEDGVIGIEIADLCAYPIARYILNNNEPNVAFDVIRPKIRSNARGGIIGFGIKTFPK